MHLEPGSLSDLEPVGDRDELSMPVLRKSPPGEAREKPCELLLPFAVAKRQPEERGPRYTGLVSCDRKLTVAFAIEETYV